MNKQEPEGSPTGSPAQVQTRFATSDDAVQGQDGAALLARAARALDLPPRSPNALPASSGPAAAPTSTRG